MDCNQYRRTVLAEPLLLRPDHETLELRAHRESCHACREYAERLLRFESRLERALRVEVPGAGDASRAGAGGGASAFAGARPGAGASGAAAGADVDSGRAVGARDEVAPSDRSAPSDPVAPSDRVVPFRRKGQSAAPRPPFLRAGWRALAASVLLAVVVAGALFISAPGSSLAADVVTHMAGEPQAWRVTDVAVSNPDLEAVLRDSHLRLSNGAGIVSYASSCAFRGHVVPHLVIQTGAGPVTVMVLVHETVSKSVPFDEQGYRGVIVPVPGHGSLAVLTRAPDTDTHAVEQKAIDQIAAQVEDSIVWTG